jgi:hypothetical protein
MRVHSTTAMRESHKTGHEAAKLEIALLTIPASRIGMLIPALVTALFAWFRALNTRMVRSNRGNNALLRPVGQFSGYATNYELGVRLTNDGPLTLCREGSNVLPNLFCGDASVLSPPV